VLTPAHENDPAWRSEIAALVGALSALGWREGHDLRIEYQFGEGDPNRLATGAKALVGARPDVLLTRSTTAVKALARETRVIPIVFISVADPVGEKLAESLARPGGNVTGFTNVEAAMAGKWLDLLKEIVPRSDGSGFSTTRR
jgi:putative ABC transport system substrate-binding protein